MSPSADLLFRLALTHLIVLLEAGDPVTPARVREVVKRLAVISPELADEELEAVARRLEENIVVTVGDPDWVQDDEYRPWLHAKFAAMDRYYWMRYKAYLEDGRMAAAVVSELGKATEQVLDRLQDPDEPGPWDRRGLVIGSVQSGKTSNYIGLMAQAADAGYRVIVVLAGIHNMLRNQTQQRIDEGFVGTQVIGTAGGIKFESVGVGLRDARRRPAVFTSKTQDFTRAIADGVGFRLMDLAEPAVFVIKKNSKSLSNLLTWLKGLHPGQIDLPMLLIDDEADNASINIRYRRADALEGTTEVSRINGQIRSLLGQFTRSAYVGYTATPFANIFIDPEESDLFPRNFIFALDEPSNYFGPRTVFGGVAEADEDPKYVRFIDTDDAESLIPLKHKISHHLSELPSSLKDAVMTYVLARGMRILRGDADMHSSMLVNASRFVSVQRQVGSLLQRLLDQMQDAIRMHSGLSEEEALGNPIIAELHARWLLEYAEAGFEWQDVQPVLQIAIAPIQVRVVNSESQEALNYGEHELHGLHVIAVGGFSLSRGLTLEGLVVSYFYRNTLMYDTLLQMGRWFGYRPGYEDLCRVWASEQAASWYEHILNVVEELREELRTMRLAGLTPKDFGLRVKTHPETLMITARNKAGFNEIVTVEVGLAGTLVETSTFLAPARDANLAAALRFGEAIASAGHTSSAVGASQLFSGLPVALVTGLLTEWKNHPAWLKTDNKLVLDYIERQGDGFDLWDVLLVGRGDAEPEPGVSFAGLPIRCQRRTKGDVGKLDKAVRSGNSDRISSRGIERAGLPADVVAEVEREFHESRPGVYVPDVRFRKRRSRPLLMLHFLRWTDESSPCDIDGLWFGWGISFPFLPDGVEEHKVQYAINGPAMRSAWGVTDEDLEDAEDD